MRSLQEIEELKRICCAAAERAKQLRIDELSIQEKESQSNLFVTSGNVFENPLAPDEPTASFFGNVYARSLTATHCELVSLNTGRSVPKMDEQERNGQNLAVTYTEICQEVFNLESLSCRRSLSAELYV